MSHRRLIVTLGAAVLMLSGCSHPKPYVLIRDGSSLVINTTECLRPVLSISVASSGELGSGGPVSSSSWILQSSDPGGTQFPEDGITIGEVPDGWKEIQPVLGDLVSAPSIVVSVEKTSTTNVVSFGTDLSDGEYTTAANRRGQWDEQLAARGCT